MLRPEPHRGDVVAAGVVVLTVLVTMINVRFDGTWGQGVHFVYSAFAAGFVIAMAALSVQEGDRPRAYQSTLFVASFALALLALIRLADILGANNHLSAPGTRVWIGTVLVALMAWFAVRRNSAIATLIGSVTFGVVVVSFVSWVFHPHSISTPRAILVTLTLAFVLAAVTQRDRRPRHAVHFVNAAGLSALALAITFAIGIIFGGIERAFGGTFSRDVGWGWELFLLVVACGLIAYGAVEREPGPAYLGVANLIAFTFLAAPPSASGASLVGWPLLLLVVAGGVLAIGLRPSRPLPPEPGTGATAPTTPLPLEDSS